MSDHNKHSAPAAAAPAPAPKAPEPVEPLDTSDETAAEVRGRKANPALEHVLDELEVAIFNLPHGTSDSAVNRLKGAHAEILGVAKGLVPSKSDLEAQAKAEAHAKKPQ